MPLVAATIPASCALPQPASEQAPTVDTAVRVTFESAYTESLAERSVAVRSVVGRVAQVRSRQLFVEVSTAVREDGGRTRALSGLVIPIDLDEEGVRVVVLNTGARDRDTAVMGVATGLVVGAPLLFMILWGLGCGASCT